jgi:hypothetical protein
MSKKCVFLHVRAASWALLRLSEAVQQQHSPAGIDTTFEASTAGGGASRSRLAKAANVFFAFSDRLT